MHDHQSKRLHLPPLPLSRPPPSNRSTAAEAGENEKDRGRRFRDVNSSLKPAITTKKTSSASGTSRRCASVSPAVKIKEGNECYTLDHRATEEPPPCSRGKFAGELRDPGQPPTSSAPRQLEAEAPHDPPCCCTPPRSCPAPGESACPAARSSSWRTQSRALHICRSPFVCRAGTWWRLGRRAGRRGSGLGHEKGGEPGLGPRIRGEAGPGRSGTA